MNVTIKRFLEAADFQIQEGAEFQWECYGPNARFFDCGNFTGCYGKLPYWTAGCVFDTKTQVVYELRVHDDPMNEKKKYHAWRWINPKYLKASKEEHERKGYRFKEAVQSVDYKDVSAEKILETLRKVVAKHSA